MAGEHARQRVLILGADGADPEMLARLMAEGQLPNLSRLCAQGAWGPLQTTFPPVSPVAWTTCLTGVPPAEHGIRDFITKARDTYLPTIGLFEVSGGSDGIPVYTGRRTAPTVAERLSDAGRAAYLLKVPGTFPPFPVRGGVLAGFGMPDLLGTFGVSAWYTTDEAGKKAAAPQGRELVSALTPAGPGAWQGQIAGPAGSRQAFTLRRAGNEALLYLAAGAGQPAAVLPVGAWSGWVRLVFDVPGRGRVEGLCRFKLVSLAPAVQLYRTPVQCAPGAPLFALAEPPGFGARLEDWVGPYATVGMPADVDGVRRGVVDLDTFLEDAYTNWEQQVDMTLRLMEAAARGSVPPWDLLMTHLFTIDNVQHLFWHCQDPGHPAYTVQLAARYGDEIRRAYRWLDAQVRRLEAHAVPGTTLIVVSDHGGTPIYRLAYPNAWLRSQGYLVPREETAPGVAARIEWSATRAVMFGTGGIWLNVQGREPRGTVPPGAPYEAVRQEIAHALAAWHDPETGQPVVKQVFRGEEVFGVLEGAAEGSGTPGSGPDLVIALQPGYGLGRGEGLGRVMSGTPPVVSNPGPWSGGHEGPYLPSDVPGICILGAPDLGTADLDGAGLQDIAPTVLHLLGLEGVGGMRGRSLL